LARRAEDGLSVSPNVATMSVVSRKPTVTPAVQASRAVSGGSSTPAAVVPKGVSASHTAPSLSSEDATLLIKLKRAVAELKDSSVKMQEERDFYFGKLRQIELLTQDDVAVLDKAVLVTKIQDILYAPLSSE
jgi:hypothetical protein